MRPARRFACILRSVRRPEPDFRVDFRDGRPWDGSSVYGAFAATVREAVLEGPARRLFALAPAFVASTSTSRRERRGRLGLLGPDLSVR
jgi:hypothetical protein